MQDAAGAGRRGRPGRAAGEAFAHLRTVWQEREHPARNNRADAQHGKRQRREGRFQRPITVHLGVVLASLLQRPPPESCSPQLFWQPASRSRLGVTRVRGRHAQSAINPAARQKRRQRASKILRMRKVELPKLLRNCPRSRNSPPSLPPPFQTHSGRKPSSYCVFRAQRRFVVGTVRAAVCATPLDLLGKRRIGQVGG